jgi:hypothetical protein
MVVVSSSVGSVKLFRIDGKDQRLADFKEMVSWDNIHYFRYAKRTVACGKNGELLPSFQPQEGWKYVSHFGLQV